MSCTPLAFQYSVRYYHSHLSGTDKHLFVSPFSLSQLMSGYTPLSGSSGARGIPSGSLLFKHGHDASSDQVMHPLSYLIPQSLTFMHIYIHEISFEYVQ